MRFDVCEQPRKIRTQIPLALCENFTYVEAEFGKRPGLSTLDLFSMVF